MILKQRHARLRLLILIAKRDIPVGGFPLSRVMFNPCNAPQTGGGAACSYNKKSEVSEC
jgi:hypothetical protein